MVSLSCCGNHRLVRVTNPPTRSLGAFVCFDWHQMFLTVQEMHSERLKRYCAYFILILRLLRFHTYISRIVLHVGRQDRAGSLGSSTSSVGAALLKVPVTCNALFICPCRRLQHAICICLSVSSLVHASGLLMTYCSKVFPNLSSTPSRQDATSA